MDNTQTKHNKVKFALIFLTPIIFLLLILNSISFIKNLYLQIFYSYSKGYTDEVWGPITLGFFLAILLIVNTLAALIVGISIKDRLSEKLGYGLITFGCGLALTLVLSVGWFIFSVFLA